MSQYKASRYNHWVETEKKELLLYNAFRGSFHKVAAPQKDSVLRLLSARQFEDGAQPLEELLEKGFLVPADLDEKKMLDYLYLDVVDNDNLGITIFTTEQCNFRCKYCYEPFVNPSMSTEVQDAIIRFVRKHINRYHSLEVSWFGGEPLMALDVIRRMSKAFMDICRFYKKPYFASITTNAYLLTEDVFRELLSYHVVKYQITLDGGKETHDAQRVLADGSGTFDRIMENLTAISRNVKSKRFDIMLRTNYTRPIYKTIDSYLSLLQENFQDDMRFSMLPRLVNDMGGESVKTIAGTLFQDDRNDAMNSIYDKLLQHELRLNYGAMAQLLQPGAGMCYVNKKNVFSFDTKGTMHKCQSGYQRDHLTAVGKQINSSREIQIDTNEAYKWIGSLQQIHSGCKDCFFLPVCFGGACPLMNYKQSLIPDAPPQKPGCPYEKNTLDRILLLLDKSGYFDTV